MENVTTTPATTPRLYRSSTDRAIAGVCGGLAHYFKVDPALVRILFIVFALAGGASLLLYLILSIAVPSDHGAPVATVSTGGGQEMLASILIAVGGIWLLANLGAFTFVQWRFAWPVILVVFGIALLVRRVSR